MKNCRVYSSIFIHTSMIKSISNEDESYPKVFCFFSILRLHHLVMNDYKEKYSFNCCLYIYVLKPCAKFGSPWAMVSLNWENVRLIFWSGLSILYGNRSTVVLLKSMSCCEYIRTWFVSLSTCFWALPSLWRLPLSPVQSNHESPRCFIEICVMRLNTLKSSTNCLWNCLHPRCSRLLRLPFWGV